MVAGQRLGLSLEGTIYKTLRGQWDKEKPSDTSDSYISWVGLMLRLGERRGKVNGPATKPLTLLPSSMITTPLWAYS
jgi:hypothetical protein